MMILMRKHISHSLVATLFLLAAPVRADIPPGPPPSSKPEAKVRGSLDKEVIRRVIREHIHEVKNCYVSSLGKKPDLEGRVIVRFTVSKDGDVTEAQTQETTMNHPPTEDCINTAVKTWKFPKPQGGGIVIISYPFVLKANGPPPPNKSENKAPPAPPAPAPAPAPAKPAR